MSGPQSVVVLGGGISGLAAAWRLSQVNSGASISLLERSSRLGGWIQSYKTENGAIMETGPRSVRVSGDSAKSTLKMIESLGIASSMLPVKRSHPAARNRFIYTTEHGLLPLPSGPSWLLRAKPPFSKPLIGTLLREPFISKTAIEEDESIRDFILRRFGQEVADYLIDPLCRGVFAGRADELSVRSCFPWLHQYEQQYGSIIRGLLFNRTANDISKESRLLQHTKKERWVIYSFKEGIHQLVTALEENLVKSGISLQMERPCTEIQFTDDGRAKVYVNDGSEVILADHVISSLPSEALAPLLPNHMSALIGALTSITGVSVALMNVEFKGQVLPNGFRESFGYLVPSNQNEDILGVVNDSCSFPEHNRPDLTTTRLTVMMGGAWFKELFGDPEKANTANIEETGLSALRQHLGITSKPTLTRVFLQKNCIPQYKVGHHKILDTVNKEIRKLPLSLIGASYFGVSVNDCIDNAIKCVDKIMKHV